MWLVIAHIFIFSLTHVQGDMFLKRDHSLMAPYLQGNWDFSGSTLITGSKVVLTADRQSQAGIVWNNKPITMRNWEVAVHFKVHGNDGLLYGDGIGIWYISEPSHTSGNVFGLTDKFRGLALFLDTYSNHNGPHHHDHPYISAMINNGSQSYDHDTDGTHTQLAGCTSYFRNKNHDTRLVITYLDDTLTVQTDVDNRGELTKCFSVHNIVLPTNYYLAFSAATGELSDNHEILSVKTYELRSQVAPFLDNVPRDDVEPTASGQAEVEREHTPDDAKPRRWSDWTTLLFILFVVIAIGAFVVFGIAYYNEQQKSRKRFY